MNRIRAIIVEDEPLAQKRLMRLLATHKERIEIVGTADNVSDAVTIIEQLLPQLLFLDIKLPGATGFDVLGRLTHRPAVIFTTAFAEHAIRAFEENALDYLLKPIEPKRLSAAIHRVEAKRDSGLVLPQDLLATLAQQLTPTSKAVSIPVKVGERFIFVSLDTVTHFQAKDKYVYVHTQDGKEYLTDHTLVSLSHKLPANFIQVHRSIIVNRNAIQEVLQYFNNKYILHVGASARVKIITGPKYAEKIRGVLSF